MYVCMYICMLVCVFVCMYIHVYMYACQAPYLSEWVEYHLMSGVQHMYLYNHKSVDNATAELEPYVRAGRVCRSLAKVSDVGFF